MQIQALFPPQAPPAPSVQATDALVGGAAEQS